MDRALAPTLVLLPGLNNTGAVWDDVVSLLGSAARCQVAECAVLDTVEAVADDLLARLPARFHLAGFSFGGYVALAMLERAPQRIAGLALVNSSARADSDLQRIARQKSIETALQGGYEAMAAAQAPMVFHRDSLGNSALMLKRVDMVRAYGAARLIAHTRACMARPDRSAVVGSARCPVLVAAAAGDRVIPAAAQKALAETVPDAAYVEIGAAGHMLPLEQPKALADALRVWLAGTPAKTQHPSSAARAA